MKKEYIEEAFEEIDLLKADLLDLNDKIYKKNNKKAKYYKEKEGGFSYQVYLETLSRCYELKEKAYKTSNGDYEDEIENYIELLNVEIKTKKSQLKDSKFKLFLSKIIL